MPTLAFVKLAVPAILGAWAMLDMAGGQNIVAYLGVGFFVAGALLVGRYREALAISERERKTLAEINVRLTERNAILEAQPNLEQHARLLSKMLDKADEQTRLLREIRQAVVSPR